MPYFVKEAQPTLHVQTKTAALTSDAHTDGQKGCQPAGRTLPTQDRSNKAGASSETRRHRQTGVFLRWIFQKVFVAVRSCHSAIQLRRHRKASPVLSILRTPTRKIQAGELDCQGKRTRTNSPWIVYAPAGVCLRVISTAYSDIQFTPTGDEPVIKTYVSVHKGTAESRMKRLFRKEAYRQASL